MDGPGVRDQPEQHCFFQSIVVSLRQEVIETYEDEEIWHIRCR